MAENKGKKKKIRWIFGSQLSGLSISVPATRRQARRGINPPRKHNDRRRGR